MVNALQPMYSVFVDVLEFRDLAFETITSIASSQVHLDIVSIPEVLMLEGFTHLCVYVFYGSYAFCFIFNGVVTQFHLHSCLAGCGSAVCQYPHIDISD